MKDGLFGTMKEANEGAKLQWYVVDCPKLGFRNNIMRSFLPLLSQ